MKRIYLIFLLVFQCVGLSEKSFFDPSTSFGFFIHNNLCSVLKICLPRKSAFETSHELTSFLFSVPPTFGIISDSKVNILVPYFTNRSKLKAGFTHNGNKVDVNNVIQESGVTENDFNRIQKYKVTSRDGNSRIYDVEVKNASINSKELLSFGFVNPDVTGFITGNITGSGAIKISVLVPFGTNLTNLVAKFTITGSSIQVSGTNQENLITPNNFSSPVLYTVYAADGTTKNYEITVLVGGSTDKDILAFGFLSYGVVGVISGTNITVNLPSGVSAYNQIPYFSTNGKLVKVSGNIQISNSTQIDFSSTVIYTVEANDGSTKNYTVNLILSTISDKEMTSFSIPSVGANSVISSSADSGIITLNLPPNSDLTNTVALFQINGVNAYINEREQISGQTFNNFSNPPTYTISAQDGSKKNFKVVLAEGIFVSITGLTSTGLVLSNGQITTSIAPSQTSVLINLDPNNNYRVLISSQAQGQTCAFSGNSSGNLSIASPPSLSIVCANGFLFNGKILSYDPLTRPVLNTDVMTLTTIAGLAGSNGFIDNSTGTSARLNQPMSFTKIGNFLYLPDIGNHSIRRIDTNSPYAVTTIVGNGTLGNVDGVGSAGRFTNPHGITTDGVNLFICDWGNHTIRKINLQTNELFTLAGLAGSSGNVNGIGNVARFNLPIFLTYHDGNLYISDENNNSIRRLNLATNSVTTVATGFSNPGGIATDGTNLYIADRSNHQIKRIVISTGVVTTLAGSGTQASYDSVGTNSHFNSPLGLDLESGILYIIEGMGRKFRKLDLGSNRVSTFFTPSNIGGADGGMFAAQMCNLIGCGSILVDGPIIYFADRSQRTIRKLESGLVRHYPLAGNANEATGTGQNGSFVGSPTPATNQNAITNGAMHFTGSSYMTATDTGLPSGNSARTICAWIKADEFPSSNNQMILSYGTNGDGNNSLLSLLNLGGQFVQMGSIGSNCSSVTVACSFPINTFPLNTWVHICGSIDGAGNGKLYMNGKVIDSSPTGKNFNTTLGGGLTIGSQNNFGSIFRGKISDVRIYNRALSVGEVAILGTNISEGLVANFPFNQALGGLVNGEDDIWFNRINMTPVSVPTISGDNRLGVGNELGNSLSVNGTNQYLENTSTANLLPSGNSPRTICAWARPSLLPGGGDARMVLTYGVGEANCLGLLNDGSNPVRSLFCTLNGGLDLNSDYMAPTPTNTTGFVLNTWYHLCATYDGANMSSYVNGTFIGTQARTLNTDTSRLRIGVREVNIQFFGGLIDEVRIYSRMLSLAEIRELATPTKRMFLTTNSYTGNLGGISGADIICNSDPNRPRIESIYKAFLVSDLTRRACVNANCTTSAGENLDWVLKQPYTYYQAYDTSPAVSSPNSFPIFTISNSAGTIIPISTPLLFRLGNIGHNPWSGFFTGSPTPNWTLDSSGHCNNWTNASVGTGSIGWWGNSGSPTNTVDSLLDGNSSASCTTSRRFICVEQ